MFDPRCRPYRKTLTVIGNKIHTVTTHGGKSIWGLIIKYINKKDDGDIFTRRDFIDSIYTHPIIEPTTADAYRNRLTKVGILQDVRIDGFIEFKKLRDIPNELTTRLLQKMSNQKTWESWFYQLDHLPK